MPMCSPLEMPVGASPPNPHTEDEPLSTDPVDWPSVLTDRIRTLVCRGPSEVPPNFVFPRNEGDGRSCHQYFRKTLGIWSVAVRIQRESRSKFNRSVFLRPSGGKTSCASVIRAQASSCGDYSTTSLWTDRYKQELLGSSASKTLGDLKLF
uniref:Uncharacterized protein n=1 Tax=Hucho hucho TaxID=62062 RepID=A0A4W5LI13_9TELE